MKKSKFTTSFIRSVTNHKFPGLVNEVLLKVKEIEVEEGQVKTAYQRLVNNSDKLGFVKIRLRSHPMTELIDAKTDERRDILRSIRSVVNGKVLSPNDSERADALVLNRWISDYKGKLAMGGARYQNNVVSGLNTTLKESVEIQNALSNLGLQEPFDMALSMTDEIVQLLLSRSEDLAKNKAMVRKIRNQATDDFLILLQSIANEAKLETGDERVFRDLFNTLNEILANHRLSYKLSVRNRKVSENNDDPDSDSSVSDVEDSEL